MSGTLASSPPARLDVARIRDDFPILERRVRGKRLVYLDNAATTQKPQTVIDRLVRFYREENANIHRGLHALSVEATDSYDAGREVVRRFLNDHCCQPLMARLGVPATARASLALYNRREEIDALVTSLRTTKAVFA